MTGAVLFDMDGVLLETEGMKARAHSETIAAFGGVLPPESYSDWMGRSQHEVQAGFAAAARLTIPDAAYSAVFTQIYRRMLEAGVETTPGAFTLLTDLRRYGYRLALVTSSLRWMLDHVFRAVELRPLFDAMVCAEDVAREKPAPDAYLRALELLQMAPEAAVVVEDTEVGMAAAVAAGCRVITVRHAYNGRHDFSGAVKILPGLTPTASAVEAIRYALSP